ncbi:MAG: hypothetical protein JNK02_13060 [Planctomycetes bacterium]|nr:hypothetical protein [Planctomycetota bacterium]
MKIVILLVLASLTSLAACGSTNRAALGAAGSSNKPGGCCATDCEAVAECRPDGTCLITCTLPDGSRCEVVVDCSGPCTGGSCEPQVECLPDGRCRVTCTADDGTTCEVTVDCATGGAARCTADGRRSG